MTSDRRPRHYATDLVSAWVRGEALPAVPEQHVELARAHAKNICQQIKFHVQCHTPADQIKGSKLAEWVAEYRSRKSA